MLGVPLRVPWELWDRAGLCRGCCGVQRFGLSGCQSASLRGVHVVCSNTTLADLAAGLGLVSDQKILLILLLAVAKS